MARICIDSIGPFEKDAQGNQYIIVVIDCMTRHVELYPAKTANAESAATAVVKHTGRFGTPSQVVTDGGSQYVTDLMHELAAHVGFEKVQTNPHSSEENGLVERANKEVIRFLRGLMYNHKEIRRKLDLEVHLPVVERIINSNYQRRLGCSPFDILFGGQLEISPMTLIPGEEVEKNSEAESHPGKVDGELQQKVEAEQAKLSEKEKKTKYQVGELVYIQYPKTSYGIARESKWGMNLRGPFVIRSVKEDDRYVVHNSVSGRDEEYHVKRLSPAIVREQENPEELARQSEDVWLIEKIISHRGQAKKRPTTFKVKWVGFEETTMEPWRRVMHTQKLHEYLREKKLVKWIPKIHQKNSEDISML